MRYAFSREHESKYPVRRLCKVMAVHPSGYYAWQTSPESKRSIEDRCLLGHIKQSWLESGAVYGYREVHDDLRELRETCGYNRVYRLMRHADIRSQTGYHRTEGMTMPDINPFANEADSIEIGDLTIENRLDQVSIYGDVQLTKDKRGLGQAKALKAVLDAVVQALETDKNLPDKISFKPTDEVENPFK